VVTVAEDRDEDEDPTVEAMFGAAEDEIAFLERLLRLTSIARPTGRTVTLHLDLIAQPEGRPCTVDLDLIARPEDRPSHGP